MKALTTLLLMLVAACLACGVGPAFAAEIDEASDLCSSTEDPCIVNDTHTVVAGITLDFGTRVLQISDGGQLDIGSGTVSILCGGLTVDSASGTAIKATGDDFSGGDLTVTAYGTCSDDALQACLEDGECSGTCGGDGGTIFLGSKIVGSNEWPATVTLYAAGDITIDKNITLAGTTSDSDGGELDVQSYEGSVTINGNVDVTAGGDSTGGDITVAAGDDVTVASKLDASGGDFDGGNIDITATDDVDISADLTVSSSNGEGGGGSIGVTAGGDITMASSGSGNIVLQADGNKSSDNYAGDGGYVQFIASGDITVSSTVRMRANGAKPDGAGGMVELTAGGDLSLAGQLNALGKGSDGMGGDIDLAAGGDIVVSGSAGIDATGKGGAGTIGLLATDAIAFSGEADASAEGSGLGGAVSVRAGTTLDLSGDLIVDGSPLSDSNGTIDLTACDVNVSSGGSINNEGSYGANTITGADSIVIASGAEMLADTSSGSNTLTYGAAGTPPSVLGTVSPAASLALSGTLTSCGASATTTTTTGASTTTTTTGTPTTTVVSGGACGDVTGDSQVKATDALYVLKKAVSIYTAEDLTCESSWTCCGDVTGDSQVKATDALYVLKLAVSIYTAADLDCSCGSGTTSALSVLGPSGA